MCVRACALACFWMLVHTHTHTLIDRTQEVIEFQRAIRSAKRNIYSVYVKNESSKPMIECNRRVRKLTENSLNAHLFTPSFWLTVDFCVIISLGFSLLFFSFSRSVRYSSFVDWSLVKKSILYGADKHIAFFPSIRAVFILYVSKSFVVLHMNSIRARQRKIMILHSKWRNKSRQSFASELKWPVHILCTIISVSIESLVRRY